MNVFQAIESPERRQQPMSARPSMATPLQNSNVHMRKKKRFVKRIVKNPKKEE